MSKVFGKTLLDDMARTESLPLPLVKQAAKEILEVVREGLRREGVVKVSNFGTFRLKPVAARRGINPRTGEAITIPAKQKVIFTPSKSLRDLIQPIYQPPLPIGPDRNSSNAPEAAQQAKDNAVESLPIGTKQITETHTDIASEPHPNIPQEAHDTMSAECENVSKTATEEPNKQPESKAAAELRSMPFAPERIEEVEVRDVSSEATAVITPEAVAEPHTHAKPSSVTEESPLDAGDAPPQSNRQNPLGIAVILLIALVVAGLLIEWETEVDDTPQTSINNTVENQLLGTAAADAPLASGEMATDETPLAIAEAVTEGAPPPIDTDEMNTPVVETEPVLNQVPAESKEYAVENPAPNDNAVVADSGSSGITQSASDYFFIEQPHRVRAGESLWRLARHHYHDPLLWPHIYQANTAAIDDPDYLLVGRTITIPGLEGSPNHLSKTDRRNIAEGYYLAYLHYKKLGREDALFALLEAKRYDNKVVEEHRSLMQLTRIEELQLAQQQTMPF